MRTFLSPPAALEPVVPVLGDPVAVDAGGGVREAGGREVVLAADAVVVVMLLPARAVDLVEADHVVHAAETEGDALRTGRMAPVPSVRPVAPVVDLVVLDDEAVHRAGAAAEAAHAGVHVDADLPAAAVGVVEASPAADVVALDDHVMRAVLQRDRVGAGALERQA